MNLRQTVKMQQYKYYELSVFSSISISSVQTHIKYLSFHLYSIEDSSVHQSHVKSLANTPT